MKMRENLHITNIPQKQQLSTHRIDASHLQRFSPHLYNRERDWAFMKFQKALCNNKDTVNQWEEPRGCHPGTSIENKAPALTCEHT